MILAFFSSARMILSECHESPAFIHGFLHRLIPGIGGSNRAVPWRNDNRAKSWPLVLRHSPSSFSSHCGCSCTGWGFWSFFALVSLACLYSGPRSPPVLVPVTLLHFSDDGCIAICYCLESPLCLNHLVYSL